MRRANLDADCRHERLSQQRVTLFNAVLDHMRNRQPVID